MLGLPPFLDDAVVVEALAVFEVELGPARPDVVLVGNKPARVLVPERAPLRGLEHMIRCLPLLHSCLRVALSFQSRELGQICLVAVMRVEQEAVASGLGLRGRRGRRRRARVEPEEGKPTRCGGRSCARGRDAPLEVIENLPAAYQRHR